MGSQGVGGREMRWLELLCGQFEMGRFAEDPRERRCGDALPQRRRHESQSRPSPSLHQPTRRITAEAAAKFARSCSPSFRLRPVQRRGSRVLPPWHRPPFLSCHLLPAQRA
ncbi:hypothetical protein G6O67_004729 [Ophiocordyceps sinensis]|uniref:Uncharacterized protein n=1 Tax=Ophiocordyceps sinensis TaxID=72228 RepID=A0A8H4PQ37_9HYPO|nr:hypothetical protein G6O67_004729 [Ophiocordyceps sinensis]